MSQSGDPGRSKISTVNGVRTSAVAEALATRSGWGITFIERKIAEGKTRGEARRAPNATSPSGHEGTGGRHLAVRVPRRRPLRAGHRRVGLNQARCKGGDPVLLDGDPFPRRTRRDDHGPVPRSGPARSSSCCRPRTMTPPSTPTTGSKPTTADSRLGFGPVRQKSRWGALLRWTQTSTIRALSRCLRHCPNRDIYTHLGRQEPRIPPLKPHGRPQRNRADGGAARRDDVPPSGGEIAFGECDRRGDGKWLHDLVARACISGSSR